MMDDRLVRHPLGFWQLKDPPDAETLRAYYTDLYYQTAQSNYRPEYPPEEIAWFSMKIERIAAAVAGLGGEVAHSGSFLDVGCGEGFAMDWFSRHNWDVRGLDYSREGLERMNPHLLDRLETGDLPVLLDVRIAAGSTYDLLWLTNVLEHVSDPLNLLCRLKKLGAPGGACVVTVPNDGSALQEALFSSGRIPSRFWIAILDHLSYFDAASLRAVAAATGWRCIRVLADFPIDWFLANPEAEYISDRSKGRGAHQACIAIDSILAGHPIEAVNTLYEALAAVGMDRQLTAILTCERN